MADITLVRHGQANSHATDEVSYDQLSDLGRTQAKWLGEHMIGTETQFERVLTGTLQRQIETATAMGFDSPRQDPRLNELSYFGLAQAASDEHGVDVPVDPTGFAAHLPVVMNLWSNDALRNVPESFQAFSMRIIALVREMCALPGRTLLVTSGGVIGMVMRHTLELDNAATVKLMLQTANSSVHRLRYVHETLMVAGFNATPHLDLPDRQFALTYV